MYENWWLFALYKIHWSAPQPSLEFVKIRRQNINQFIVVGGSAAASNAPEPAVLLKILLAG